MASITLKVEIGELTNAELDEIEDKFYKWVREKYPSSDAPPGTIDDVTEDDREEDEEDEEETKKA